MSPIEAQTILRVFGSEGGRRGNASVCEARVAEHAVKGGSARARPTGAGDGVVGHC